MDLCLLGKNQPCLKPYIIAILSVKERFPNQLFVTRAIEPVKKKLNTSKVLNTKIFVGGIPHLVSSTEFLSYFGNFGKITSFLFPKAKDASESNGEVEKNRGYGFIIYDSIDATKKVMNYHKNHILRSKVVG